MCGDRGLVHKGEAGGAGAEWDTWQHPDGRSGTVCGDSVSDAGFAGKPCSGSCFVPGSLRLPSCWPWTMAVPVSSHRHFKAGED